MGHIFYPIARFFWPQLEEQSEQRRLVGVGDVIITLFTAPFALAGLIWLWRASRPELLVQEWKILLLLGVLIFIFNRIKYFFIIEIRTDRYGSADGSLGSTIQWAAVFLFGATTLWLSVIGSIVSFLTSLSNFSTPGARWNRIRSLSLELTSLTLAYLIALRAYARLGGSFPPADLSPGTILIALAALLVHFGIVLIIWSGYTAYAIWIQQRLSPSGSMRPILRFFVLALGFPDLAHPFSILIAGLYVQYGLFTFLFILAGMMLVAYMARQLSWAAESSRQQSRQLEKLEQLSRDILNAPLDASQLPNLLGEHLLNMFPSGRVVVWLAPDRYLHKHPDEWAPDMEPIWEWVRLQEEASEFTSKEKLPWQRYEMLHDPVVTAPILDVEHSEAMGLIYIELRALSQPWDRRALKSLFPAVKSLGAQVASTLHQADIYAETLEYQSAMQELEFAGRIQSSFLPNEMPRLDGWEISVTLLPARETSGDFFDLIELSGGRVGILVADVADKGLGAALYMALSRTLIRTYALEYDAQPDIVFFSANERILQDARANLFVTAFYAVLDPESGVINYANAGHNPPILLRRQGESNIQALTLTGMPLGIDEDASWGLASTQIEPGDALILYTDGIPDAMNAQGIFFKERNLMQVAHDHLGGSAQQIQSGIIDAVMDFVGDNAQFDDITLLVLVRDVNSVQLEEVPPESTSGEAHTEPTDDQVGKTDGRGASRKQQKSP